MSGKDPLNDHQIITLMKFKENVSDIIQPHHDEKILMRWLKARSWNIKAAEEMFRKSMKWRQEWEVDGALKTWQCSDVLVKYFPFGLTGFDKEGSPIVVVPVSGMDMVGLVCSVGSKEFLKKAVFEVEKLIKLALEKGGNQIIVVFDYENVAMMQYLWPPVMETMIGFLKIYEANYPELLKACYAINAPGLFALVYNIAKKFLHENTISKIHVFKNDPPKWKAALLKNIDPNALPVHYGGKLRDPDGNPKYITVVHQGGKVPKELYKKHASRDLERYKTVIIKKGDKLNLDFRVVQHGCQLKWEFCIECRDIGFGVSVLDVDGNTSIVVENKRIPANETVTTGVLECQTLSTYTVTFDNSYSYFRSKTLHYDICLIEPPKKN